MTDSNLPSYLRADQTPNNTYGEDEPNVLRVEGTTVVRENATDLSFNTEAAAREFAGQELYEYENPVERLADIGFQTQGEAPKTIAEAVDQLNDATSINVGDSRSVLNFDGGGFVFPSSDAMEEFGDVIKHVEGSRRDTPISELAGGTPELSDRIAERQARTETRQAARDAAEAAGVDSDEFGIDARADGTIVLQDRDTNQTRTIDPDEDLGDAIYQQTDGGEFVADAADPAAGATSGDGLGARVVAAVVLLLGAIAAAVGWSA